MSRWGERHRHRAQHGLLVFTVVVLIFASGCTSAPPVGDWECYEWQDDELRWLPLDEESWYLHVLPDGVCLSVDRDDTVTRVSLGLIRARSSSDGTLTLTALDNGHGRFDARHYVGAGIPRDYEWTVDEDRLIVRYAGGSAGFRFRPSVSPPIVHFRP